MLLTTALMCLATNIYYESRGEPLIGQHAVAQVVMNRAKVENKSVCQVVLRPKQFSWTAASVKYVAGKAILPKSWEPADDKAWALAKNVATVALNGTAPDLVHGATFYHEIHARPSWRHSFKVATVIGRHKFYSAS